MTPAHWSIPAVRLRHLRKCAAWGWIARSLLLLWYVVISCGIPINFTMAIRETRPAGETTDTLREQQQIAAAFKKLTPKQKQGDSCCSNKQPTVTVADHRCGCSLKRQAAGTCCCSTRMASSVPATSCCGGKTKTATKAPPSNEKETSSHSAWVSLCDCEEKSHNSILLQSKPTLACEFVTPAHHPPAKSLPLPRNDRDSASAWVIDPPPPKLA